MDIEKAINSLSGVGNDIDGDLLRHEGDVDPALYVRDMIRKPMEEARTLLATGDESGAHEIVVRTAGSILADLDADVLVSDSDQFTTGEYADRVVRPLAGESPLPAPK